MQIGKALQTIRKKLQISQKELALRCQISQTALSQIENGAKRPSQKTIKRICAVTGIPEILIYISAIQKEDVPPAKRDVYQMVYPSIITLALQLVDPAHQLILTNEFLGDPSAGKTFYP